MERPCALCIDVMRKFCARACRPKPIIRFMDLTEAAAVTTRTLTIVLPESEWQALRAVEPDAIGWLQAQIRRRLGDEPVPKRPQDDNWSDDY
jgi:hypothetical protein